LADYFARYPGVGKRASRVVRRLILKGLVARSASSWLDFDAALAFMLPLPVAVQNRLAEQLRLCREAVHLINRQRPIPPRLAWALSRLASSAVCPPLTATNYRRHVRSTRRLVRSLRASYAAGIDRVYYRRQLVDAYVAMSSRGTRTPLLSKIDRISAFLLFDDDVVDLLRDVRARKPTAILQYVRRGGSLRPAVLGMCRMVRSGESTGVGAVDDFAAALAATYEEGGTRATPF
jgi:hypothetical protein